MSGILTSEWFILVVGLIAVTMGVGWLLKRREREYPYADHIGKIEQALRDRVDLNLIYWSKTRRRFVRKLVTPESLNGLVLQAFDAERNTSRTFKITRIKEITLVTDPLHFNGELLEPPASPLTWLIIPLVLAVIVVVVLLKRSNQPVPVEATEESIPAETPVLTVTQADTTLSVSSTNPPVTLAQPQEAQASLSAFNEATTLRPDPVTAADYLHRAQERFTQHDYQGAILDCTKAMELSSFTPQTYWMRAYAEAANGDFESAIADATKAIDLNPNFYQSYYIRGTARQYLNNFPEALADLTKASELNPRDASPLNGRAWARYRSGDWAGAIQDATKALNMSPRYADAYDTRGWAKLVSGDKDGAVADCQMAVEFGGGTTAALNSKGLLSFIRGDYPAAVASWKRAIAIMPYIKADLQPWIDKAQQADSK